MRHLAYLLQSAAQVPPHDNWLTGQERKWLQGRRAPKRVADWRLGRWTAKAAIAAFLERRGEARPAHVEILAAEDGAPHALAQGAPMAISVSLSHVAGWGFCVVGEAGISLGCDLERIEPRSEEFIESYFTRAEVAMVAAAASEDRDLLTNLIWSAKESALKALRSGLRSDTRSVEVTSWQRSEYQWSSVQVISVKGAVFPGRWRRFGGLLATVVTEPPPRELDELHRDEAAERHLFPLTLGRSLPK